MKRFTKLFCLVVLVTIMGFSLAGCDSNGGGGGGTTVTINGMRVSMDAFHLDGSQQRSFVFLGVPRDTFSGGGQTSDFELRVDGIVVPITLANVSDDRIELTVAFGTFVPGTRYVIQVTYTRDAAWPILLQAGGYWDSFDTGERVITAERW